jgi:hypothetical protein
VRDHAKELCIALKEHLSLTTHGFGEPKKSSPLETWKYAVGQMSSILISSLNKLLFGLGRAGSGSGTRIIEAAQNEGRWIAVPRTIEVLQHEFQHARVDHY